MLLIFPPVAKPCEPPAGVALLSSALKEQGVECQVIDANVGGMMHLIQSASRPVDSWARRALKNRESILSDLKDPGVYQNQDRYHQRVYDLNKLLAISVDSFRFKITLSDYTDRELSPVDSRDLLKSARTFQENPFFGFFEDHLTPALQAASSNFVGISLCYLNQALTAFALAGWIKHRFKNKRIIMGGGLISSWMSRSDFNHPFDGLIDKLIRGEGEQPLLMFLERDTKGKRHWVPDYDFVRENQYLAPGTVLPFRASIGCYWSKCRFCPEKAETRLYNSQSAGRVIQDIRQIEKKYQPDYIHFIDNAVTPAVLKVVSKELFSFKWYGFVRFEKILTDIDFCRALKQSGCRMLKLGLESGDQHVLDRMNKGTDLETVSTVLKNLHAVGILTFVYLLFGTRFEDRASADKTLEYVKAHQEYINYLNLAVFNLPRFSEDALGLETREFYQGDLSLYLNFDHPSGWNRREVKQFLDKRFKKEVVSKSDIRKTPAFFSSNHAAFF